MREEWAYYPGDKLLAAHMKWDFATCAAVWLLLMPLVQEEFQKVQSYFIERNSALLAIPNNLSINRKRYVVK